MFTDKGKAMKKLKRANSVFDCQTVPDKLYSINIYLSSFLEKAMAPHSSTLAWKIPWTEDPGGLQSMGLLRVRHDWVTSLSLSCLGEGNGNPLQCSCLENPRDGGASWAAIYGVAQSWTWLKWLSSSSSIFLISKIWSYQKKVKTKLDSIQAVYNLICITWRPNLEKYIQFYPEKWNILILEW